MKIEISESVPVLIEQLYTNSKKDKKTEINTIKDKLEISNTSKAFAKLESFLNLNKKDRLDISDLSKEERDEFLKMLSMLLERGIVGYEILEVDGKPEKHFIVTQIGDERLRDAKPYNKPYKNYQ